MQPVWRRCIRDRQAIRDAVRSEVGITISAGIAPNKFLAKIASDWNKPDGQFAVNRDEVEDFLTDLPVRKLRVGKVTTEKMAKLGIESCGDLRVMELQNEETLAARGTAQAA